MVKVEYREAFAGCTMPFWFGECNLGVLFTLFAELPDDTYYVIGLVYILIVDGDDSVSFEMAFPIAYVFMCGSARDAMNKG